MSYTNLDHEVVRDNLPLVDVAMLLFKMDTARGRGRWDNPEGWGRWDDRVETVYATADGIQFGAHAFNGYFVPWVEAGYYWPPEPGTVRGSARWEGELAGFDDQGASVWGDAAIALSFETLEGEAVFDRLYSGGEWWDRTGFSYPIALTGHWFASTERDRPGERAGPDVVGALYGGNAEVAAGTLERPDLTAAFGAERTD